jgi:hypothetical protein
MWGARVVMIRVGWKGKKEVEARIRVLEFGPSSNISVSFFLLYFWNYRTILAGQISDAPIWACYALRLIQMVCVFLL